MIQICKTRLLLAPILFLMLPTSQAALLLGDDAKGKQVHDQRCVKCHNSSVYTRNPRQVQSIEGLMGRVKMCNNQLELSLDEKQLDDITSYLNKAFYKFEN
jgi:cytochrome c2